MRKGMYFMLVSTIFLLVFLTLYFIMSISEESEAIQSKNYRIQLMDDFLTDFENDLPRAMFVASFRAFIGLEEKVFETGTYYSDVREPFSELFYNGTYNGSSTNIMNDSSINDYLFKVNSIANKLGLNIDYDLLAVEMYHSNPWEIDVIINGTINLTDDVGLASWHYNSSISARVPIYDLRDPLYTVGANGQLPSPVKKWNTSIELVDDATNGTDNLQEFLNGTYYLASSDAPSFLMRFEGNNSPSPNGIVSLVNLRILGDQNVNILTGRSVVDYVYFKNNVTSNYCNISGMIFDPNWFVIDTANANLFEVNELPKTPC